MFKITARTVLELGSELISSDIIAFYELIKNGFDDGTTNGVEVRFNILLRRNAYLSLRSRAQMPKADAASLRNEAREQLNVDACDGLLERAYLRGYLPGNRIGRSRSRSSGRTRNHQAFAQL